MKDPKLPKEFEKLLNTPQAQNFMEKLGEMNPESKEQMMKEARSVNPNAIKAVIESGISRSKNDVDKLTQKVRKMVGK